MSYTVEWMGGGVVPVYGIVLLLLVVPEFAAIAVVIATIAVLVVLAAAALASPYMLVRGVRRRLRPTMHTMHPLAERPPDRLRVVGPAHVTAFAHDELDEAGAMFEDAA